MLQALSLFSFRRVFPIATIFSAMLFGALFFITRPNDGDTSLYISIGAFIVLGLIAVYMLAATARAIAVSYIEENFDGDEYSIGEVIGEAAEYVINVFLLVLTFVLAHNVLIPYIAASVGGLFQINVFGLDFNILTLVINYFFILWFFLGTAEVCALDMTFFETLPATLQFMFDNFAKLFGFIIFFFVAHCIFEFILVFTFQIDVIATIPIKILVMGYMLSACIAYATGFFLENDESEE